MSQRCVTLYGMMGAGKSAVAKELAEMLGYEAVDLDSLIEERAGKSINAIFADDGEEAFRALESEIVQQFQDAQSKVIATGGGAVLDHENRRVFNKVGLTVYLKASPRELYQRIKNDTSRPLLRSEDPKGKIAELLKERDMFYKDADIVIDTEDLSVEEVINELIDRLAQLTTGD